MFFSYFVTTFSKGGPKYCIRDVRGFPVIYAKISISSNNKSGSNLTSGGLII